MEEIKQLIFMKECCHSGYIQLREHLKNLIDNKIKYTITTVNYFNVLEQKLHEKFGFTMDDLKKHSYLYDEQDRKLYIFDN